MWKRKKPSGPPLATTQATTEAQPSSSSSEQHTAPAVLGTQSEPLIRRAVAAGPPINTASSSTSSRTQATSPTRLNVPPPIVTKGLSTPSPTNNGGSGGGNDGLIFKSDEELIDVLVGVIRRHGEPISITKLEFFFVHLLTSGGATFSDWLKRYPDVFYLVRQPKGVFVGVQKTYKYKKPQSSTVASVIGLAAQSSRKSISASIFASPALSTQLRQKMARTIPPQQRAHAKLVDFLIDHFQQVGSVTLMDLDTFSKVILANAADMSESIETSLMYLSRHKTSKKFIQLHYDLFQVSDSLGPGMVVSLQTNNTELPIEAMNEINALLGESSGASSSSSPPPNLLPKSPNVSGRSIPSPAVQTRHIKTPSINSPTMITVTEPIRQVTTESVVSAVSMASEEKQPFSPYRPPFEHVDTLTTTAEPSREPSNNVEGDKGDTESDDGRGGRFSGDSETEPESDPEQEDDDAIKQRIAQKKKERALKKKKAMKSKTKDKTSESEAPFDKFAGGPAIDDHPTGEDKLSYGRYAEQLAHVLCSPQTLPPITVGVYAAWGGGKSFFLEKLKNYLLVSSDQSNEEWQNEQDELDRLKEQDAISEARENEVFAWCGCGSSNVERLLDIYTKKWSWWYKKLASERRQRVDINQLISMASDSSLTPKSGQTGSGSPLPGVHQLRAAASSSNAQSMMSLSPSGQAAGVDHDSDDEVDDPEKVQKKLQTFDDVMASMYINDRQVNWWQHLFCCRLKQQYARKEIDEVLQPKDKDHPVWSQSCFEKFKHCFKFRRQTRKKEDVEERRRKEIEALKAEAEKKAAEMRRPTPTPSWLSKKIGVKTWRALFSIWDPLPEDNRNPSSVKPLPVKFKFIDFNSWLYSGTDSLWAAFASHLFAETEDHFGSITTRIYRARYNGAFGGLHKTLIYLALILLALIIAAGVCVQQGIQPFSSDSTSTTTTVTNSTGGDVSSTTTDNSAATKTFAGLISAFGVAFIALLVASKDIIINMVKSQAQSIQDAMQAPDFSKRMGFMSEIKGEIDIISSMMRHGQWYDDDTGVEYRSQFVIFIDDLDRCPAEKVVEVLKALVLLFSSRNAPFIAILAVDPRLVVQAIEAVHAMGHSSNGAEAMVNGYEYLEKIVQLPFCFPDLEQDVKQRLLHSFLPPEQSLRAAFMQRDYEEIATLIMKSFLDCPTKGKEPIRKRLKQVVAYWMQEELIHDLSTPEAIIARSINGDETMIGGGHASTVEPMSNCINTVIGLLTPLILDPKNIVPITSDQPPLDLIESELHKLMVVALNKYMTQLTLERDTRQNKLRDIELDAQLAKYKMLIDSQLVENEAIINQSKLAGLLSPVILDQRESHRKEVECCSLVVESGPFENTPMVDLFSVWNSFGRFKVSNLVWLHEIMIDLKQFERECAQRPNQIPELSVLEGFGEKLYDFGSLLRSIKNRAIDDDIRTEIDAGITELELQMSNIQKSAILNDIPGWMNGLHRNPSIDETDQRTLCEACSETPARSATVRCVQCDLALCPSCDVSRHASNGMKSHDRKYQPGTLGPSNHHPASFSFDMSVPATTATPGPNGGTGPVSPSGTVGSMVSQNQSSSLLAPSPMIDHDSTTAAGGSSIELHRLGGDAKEAEQKQDTTIPDVKRGSSLQIPLANLVEPMTPLKEHSQGGIIVHLDEDNDDGPTLHPNIDEDEELEEPTTVEAETSVNQASASGRPANFRRQPSFQTSLVSVIEPEFLSKPDAKSSLKSRPKVPLARQTITDYGQIDHPLFSGGWVDVSGQGVANDYARFVRPSAVFKKPFLSIALAGSIYPYTPPDMFIWNEINQCVQFNKNYRPTQIIYDHVDSIGEERGTWVANSLISGYVRKVSNPAGDEWLSVADDERPNPQSKPNEYEWADVDQSPNRLGVPAKRRLVAGSEHPSKQLNDLWWDGEKQHWIEIKHEPSSRTDVVPIRGHHLFISEGRLKPVNFELVGYFDPKTSKIRLSNEQQVMDLIAAQGKKFVNLTLLDWQTIMAACKEEEENRLIVVTGELLHHGMILSVHTEKHSERNWYRYGYTPQRILLLPEENAIETSAKSIERFPSQRSATLTNSSSVDVPLADAWSMNKDNSTATSLCHNTRRIKWLEIPIELSTCDSPPDIWIQSAYEYEPSNELGAILLKISQTLKMIHIPDTQRTDIEAIGVNLFDCYTLLQSSLNPKPQPCDGCGVSIIATAKCIQCNKTLCHVCDSAIHEPTEMRSHQTQPEANQMFFNKLQELITKIKLLTTSWTNPGPPVELKSWLEKSIVELEELRVAVLDIQKNGNTKSAAPVPGKLEPQKPVPDYTYTLRVSLLSKDKVVIDTQTLRGVTFQAETPHTHLDLYRTRYVSYCFRGQNRTTASRLASTNSTSTSSTTSSGVSPSTSFASAPTTNYLQPAAYIRWEETVTHANTRLSDSCILVQPMTIGYRMATRSRAELFAAAEAKMIDLDVSKILLKALGSIREYDAVLAHLMRTRSAPVYRPSPPGWSRFECSWVVYKGGQELAMPASNFDALVLPYELVQLDQALLPYIMEIDLWLNDIVSLRDPDIAYLTGYDARLNGAIFSSRHLLRLTHLEVADFNQENAELAKVWGLPQFDSNSIESASDRTQEQVHQYLVKLKYKYDMKTDRRNTLKYRKNNDYLLHLFWGLIPNWLLRGFVNVHPIPQLERAIHQSPLALPSDYTNQPHLRLQPTDDEFVMTIWSHAHITLLYLIAPTYLPFSFLLRESVRHMTDHMLIKSALRLHNTFMRFPSTRLFGTHTKEQFQNHYQVWTTQLEMLCAIDLLQKEFGIGQVSTHQPNADAMTVTGFNRELYHSLLSFEPRGSLEAQYKFWLECATHHRIQLFPAVLNQVKEQLEVKEEAIEKEIDAKKLEQKHLLDGLSDSEIQSLAICAPYIDGNPRRIKRVMNVYNVSRRLIDYDRHDAKREKKCHHSFCQPESMPQNKLISGREVGGNNVNQYDHHNPLEPNISLHFAFHPSRRLTWNLIQPALFRFVLLLEQWPFRSAWLLHLVQQSHKKWKHLQEVVDIIHEAKNIGVRAQTRRPSTGDAAAAPLPSTSTAGAPNVQDTVPLDAALACGMFPPSWSVLQLYRYVYPLIYGHRQPRNFDQTALGGGGTVNGELKKLQHAVAQLQQGKHKGGASHDEPISPRLSAAPVPSPSPSSQFGFVSASDFDASVKRHVKDTESLLSMDSDPDNFILFLSMPLDETKETLDPYEVTIRIDGADGSANVTRRPSLTIGQTNNGTQILRSLTGGSDEETPAAVLSTLASPKSISSPLPSANIKAQHLLATSSSVLSPLLLHVCDLFDLSYLSFNLNPALKRQVAILADITAAYQPVESLIHQFVLNKYGIDVNAGMFGLNSPTSPPAAPASSPTGGLDAVVEEPTSPRSPSVALGSLVVNPSASPFPKTTRTVQTQQQLINIAMTPSGSHSTFTFSDGSKRGKK